MSAEISLPSEGNQKRLSTHEVFHSCGVLFCWFSCSLSINAGLQVLCKSLPLGSTVLLGHLGFQKDHVIVSGTRIAGMSVSALHETCSAFQLLVVSSQQPGR